jgi:FAD/FMN-containing dehydrogenase/Fe-S oxidoreductase
MSDRPDFQPLIASLKGSFYNDAVHTTLYATDASAYREKPSGVAYPADNDDIRKLIRFAQESGITLIPRAAGTSLAGQVVGKGIVVDVSKHMTGILELNVNEKWVLVQPGVVLDELNKYLEPYGLFFGPETSTSNRCMIGGMVGNNACGSHSILYGSTRDHLLEITAFLSDGSEVQFKTISRDEFLRKCEGDALENEIYRTLKDILSDKKNQKEILKEYPDKNLHRRNTGYAIDLLLDTNPFTVGADDFNFCKLVAGSEGTLVFVTAVKLNLVTLPPKNKAVMAMHCHTLEEAFDANLIALKYQPGAVELMDKTILELTKGNIEQQKNRFFLQGEPEAILIIEFARDTQEEIEDICNRMEQEFRSLNYGYHYPVISGKEIAKIWNLRKSGLGVLSNMKGDAKPVSLIEDTAVHVTKLPAYMADIRLLMEKYKLSCVFHAHIGSGELHLRPVLNLKSPEDVKLFRVIGREVALLVKKYGGSLSGEHGDGRLRGEFIPLMIGDHNYQLLRQIKQVFDPKGIFNPGKITDTPAMDTSLRYEPSAPEKDIPTYFDFSADGGILRSIEKCNGAGDCRKSEIIGGIMCPSYQASRNEENTTRARANILREYLTHSEKKNPFDHPEIYQVLDLCLSCKGCKSECPSNVDMSKLKAEFLQHYHDAHGVPLRSWLIAHIARINRFASWFPGLTNLILSRGFMMSALGFAKERHLPELQKQTFEVWYSKHYQSLKQEANLHQEKKVMLFNDEFTNYYDVKAGIATVSLLMKLGYDVALAPLKESGRTFISKGLLRKARNIAEKNISKISYLIAENTPLIGIEPSALLTFRDEYPELVRENLRSDAKHIAANTFLIDEFISLEYVKGHIERNQFTNRKVTIALHGHCQQKAIATTQSTISMLSIPENYEVREIPSGCCGMAGSFGMEKEHYALSMQIGELKLLKQVRGLPETTLICASGTSCRQQIKDGAGRKAQHPAEILSEALK